MEEVEKRLEATANTQFSEKQYQELKDEIEKHYSIQIKELTDKISSLEKLLANIAAEMNKYDDDSDCDCSECNSSTSDDIPEDLKIPELKRESTSMYQTSSLCENQLDEELNNLEKKINDMTTHHS